MKKLFIALTIFMLSIQIVYASEQIEQSEAEIQIEAQKDLAAILQYSVKYRFSPDLKVGDKVEYRLINDPENKTDIYMEVLKEDKDGVWIVEKFAGNEIYILVDLNNMELVDLYGFDKNGIRHEIELLQRDEVNSRIEKMKQLSKVMENLTQIEEWDIQEEKKDIETIFGNMNCTILKPIFTSEMNEKIKEMDYKDIQDAENEMNILFSETVPKLIPFEFTAPLISDLSILEDIDGGLVKNSKLELKTLKKITD